MLRTKSGLPRHCSYNVDQHGKRRVRFRKHGFSIYLTGIPWSEDFMRQYAATLERVQAQATKIGERRTVAGTVDALVADYLTSGSFTLGAAETQRTRRNFLDNFRKDYGR